MAFVALPLAIGVGAAAAVGIVIASDYDDDKERQRSRKLDLYLNHFTSTIDPHQGHLGITLKGNQGVKVESVDTNDLCYQAGLRDGDWINSINGETVTRHDDALLLLNMCVKRGQTIDITYMKPKTVEFGLRKGDHLGVTVKTAPCGRGVLVTKLDPNDILAQAGIQEGDILTAVNSKYVNDHNDAVSKLSSRGLFKRKDVAVAKTVSVMSGNKVPTKDKAAPLATVIPSAALPPMKLASLASAA